MKTTFLVLLVIFTALAVVFNFVFFWFLSGFFTATFLFVSIGKAQTKKIQKQWDKKWELLHEATQNEG